MKPGLFESIAVASAADGALEVGAAALGETDLSKIDGVVNGAGAANKALVLDANRDIAGIHKITAEIFEFPTVAGLVIHPSKITADWTIPTGYNGLSAGPIEIGEGVLVTVADHATWSIV